MKAFLVTSGTIFGLMVVVHGARIVAEPHLAREPWFMIITALSAALSFWAWRLFWQSRRS
jgi:hypothetical protein